MTQRSSNKRSRETPHSDVSVAEALVVPEVTDTQLPTASVFNVPPPGPTPKRSRAEPSSPNDTDDILMVQHVVCTDCDNLYTLQAALDPHTSCVSFISLKQNLLKIARSDKRPLHHVSHRWTAAKRSSTGFVILPWVVPVLLHFQEKCKICIQRR